MKLHETPQLPSFHPQLKRNLCQIHQIPTSPIQSSFNQTSTHPLPNSKPQHFPNTFPAHLDPITCNYKNISHLRKRRFKLSSSFDLTYDEYNNSFHRSWKLQANKVFCCFIINHFLVHVLLFALSSPVGIDVKRHSVCYMLCLVLYDDMAMRSSQSNF
jgi:hypothetical protein